jgi:transposase
MKTLNLLEEIALLKNNFIAQIKEYDLPLQIKPADTSFSYWNWIITLPYNYYYLVPNTNKSIIRKLAVINALYGYYFMTEDDVFDEYHLPAEKYKIILTKYCATKGIRNLAIAQMISISGSDIYDYVYKYESTYYQSLFLEKKGYPRSGSSQSIENSIELLGEKAAPAVIPFATFCILQQCEHYIEPVEILIKRYHIAHQIFDDWQDIERDVKRPEKSWLVNHIQEEMGSEINDPRKIRKFIRGTNFNLQILELIRSNLAEAKRLVKDLKFVHFEENISHLENLAVKCFQRREV